ncbi:hypothetical protein An14g02820 [Aspergillus niger]|uniref:Uncharacterized protein n=2 Tax=Aspergillus niger TaxID=5061 RepID=A2R327_ASPNC|nr:hypothetical protein An14g02820 [Aspergillus niger]CAK41993.1 hypothetical protein An14g02820 [Aspergillus niger]
MSGWASGSSRHEGSKPRKRNKDVPPLGLSRITPDMRKRMEEEWILLKGKLFGSFEDTWEHPDGPKEEDSYNDDPYPDESSEEGAHDEEWSDNERSEEGLLDNDSFDDEPSNDSSPQDQGFWQYICNDHTDIHGFRSANHEGIHPFGHKGFLRFILIAVEYNELVN